MMRRIQLTMMLIGAAFVPLGALAQHATPVPDPTDRHNWILSP
jgi:hypothetical protein